MAAPMGQTDVSFWICYFIFVFDTLGVLSKSSKVHQDLLLPYEFIGTSQHSRTKRFTTECERLHSGKSSYDIVQSHSSQNKRKHVYRKRLLHEMIGEYSWMQHEVIGHIFQVDNPAETVSILEPGGQGGCQEQVPHTVRDTGQNCLVAVNAGYFNITSFECLGNVVSNGKVAQNAEGIQNANFGIRRDGSLFFGYVPDSLPLEDTFQQLVGGVIWLVRNGTNNVAQAVEDECQDTQTTGALSYFADVQSARTAVGVDRNGRLLVTHIEGKTWNSGINLHEFADLLIKHGAVEAINLDGGGSSTCVENGNLISYPSDLCYQDELNNWYGCEREVTTVLCVHDYPCTPADCNHHGKCVHGTCVCDRNYVGLTCDQLYCGHDNCSQHGDCTPGGCDCFPGWIGTHCGDSCPAGFYGFKCKHICRCDHGTCHHIDGTCTCQAGYTGGLCDKECAFGYYGAECRHMCYCDNGDCGCHHITGACNLTKPGTVLWQVGECVASKIINAKHLVADQSELLRISLRSLTAMSSIAACSLILNIYLIYRFLCGGSRYENRTVHQKKEPYAAPTLFDTSFSSNDESEGVEEDREDDLEWESEFTLSNRTSRHIDSKITSFCKNTDTGQPSEIKIVQLESDKKDEKRLNRMSDSA